MESKPFSKTNSERLGLSFFLADETKLRIRTILI